MEAIENTCGWELVIARGGGQLYEKLKRLCHGEAMFFDCLLMLLLLCYMYDA